MKKISLIICLCALALAGCSNPFARTTDAPKPTGNISDTLAAQSSFKKFSNPEEIRQFFEGRSQSAGSGSVMSVAADSAVKEAAPVASGLGGGGGYSTTNVQVEGVDEADIMKTDGKNLFAVSDKNLLIFDPKGGETKLLSTTVLDSRPQELYLAGDKLVVFGYVDSAAMAADSLMRIFPTNTFLAVYDISDRSKPSLVRRLEFEGGYVSSRLIENRLYFITTTYNYYPVADRLLPRVAENGAVISGEASSDKYLYPDVYYIDTPSAYNATTVAVLDIASPSDPLYSQVYVMPAGETVYASEKSLYLAYTKYLNEYQLRMDVAKEILYNRLNDRERSRIDAIAAIDSAILSDDEKASKVNQVIEAYFYRLTEAERTQVTKELDEEFGRRYADINKELEKTVIHKIAFAGGRLEYHGSGEVSGRLLNQYSLDEHDGNLRLATTRNRSWAIPFFSAVSDAKIVLPAPQNDSYSNVYVLDQNLKTVGSIEDLAKGEQIYSVRFMGNRAYLVTFRQTDPLFVLDLSDPAQPKVAGQLKIPGFSNYLHPYDETTIIGIGKMAIDKGAQGVEIQNLKLSLFNVSDPSQPKEKASLTIGGKNSDSVALYDPKAFLFSRERQLLVIPATLTKPDATDYQIDFQGSVAFTITADSIKERGRVGFRTNASFEENGAYVDDSARRNLYIGDFLYSYSPATLKVSQLADLKPVAGIDLPRPAANQGVKPLPYAETAPAR